MVPCLHQGNIYIKRKLRVWTDQKYIPLVGSETPLTMRAVKLPHLKGGSIGPRTETCGNWGGPIAMVPCLHQDNIHIKNKLRVWRDQKCISYSVQKPLLPVRAIKLPHLKGGGIGPTTETCVNLGGLFAMVLRLHQCNIHIKRKLWVWRAHKCIPLVGAKFPVTCAGCKTTPSPGRRHRAENRNLGKLRWTCCHGIAFTPRKYSYQKEVTGMYRPEMYSPSRCKNLSYRCGPSNYPV